MSNSRAASHVEEFTPDTKLQKKLITADITLHHIHNSSTHTRTYIHTQGITGSLGS